jgi:hypothetical protein
MDLGFGLFVIFILGLWLLTFVAFGLSFVKHKYVSTVSFVVFTILSIFFGYATADETKLFMPMDMVGGEKIVLAIVPVICCILSVISCVFWFRNERKIARGAGLISILAAIFVYTQI